MHVQRSFPAQRRLLVAGVATAPDQVLAAQRLRYQVFSEEYGADLGAATDRDTDRFDPHCEHIVVLNQLTGEVVATTRILLGPVADEIGGFYSETEFDLDTLKTGTGAFAELGRTCVHADFRASSALSLLWTAVSQYLLREGIDYLIGCASISMLDGGHKAWRVARKLQSDHLAPEPFRVTPKRQLPHLTATSAMADSREIPPLLKAYMRLGAQVCGPPCWDPAFRCADLLVLLEVKSLAGRYARKFMRQPLSTG
ncbi:GNAT family N-acetyltransferase [Marinobacter salicampi]|uniref:GNAT family N-acetyltransferase n=1 Tax=Marinobacter salicampi TaxID=435907 RepID=UPI00140DB4BB|nr:GNAT family N-acyltransferase [Marinobacter salicampi]